MYNVWYNPIHNPILCAKCDVLDPLESSSKTRPMYRLTDLSIFYCLIITVTLDNIWFE